MALNDRAGRVLLTTTVSACVLSLSSGALAQTTTEQATDRRAAPVAVVESVPLSVSGAVSISGAPDVTVKNTAADPALVRDVDRVMSEPFQTGTPPTFFETNFGAANLVTVPAGKRLVVEYASAWVNASSAGGLLAISLSTAARANDLTCHPQGQNALNHIYTCATPMKQYVEAGESLTFIVQTLSNSGGNFRVFVSGHYETVP